MTVGTQRDAFGFSFPFGLCPTTIASKPVDRLFCLVADYMVKVNDGGVLCAAVATLLFCLVAHPVLTTLAFVFSNNTLVAVFVLFVPALGVFLLLSAFLLRVFVWH